MSILESLAQGARETALPATVSIKSEVLLCTEMLRWLPRKRAAMRGQWRGAPVLVKLMPNTFSGRRNAAREITGHRLLSAAQINTPGLILFARADDKSIVLLFEFVPAARRLGGVWRSEIHRRVFIAERMITILARLHAVGARHTDCHLDNFLMHDGVIVAVDCGAIRSMRNTRYGSWQRNNLALFFAFFAPAQQEILFVALAAHYSQAANDAKLPRAITTVAKHRRDKNLDKCFRECTDFATHKSWHMIAVWRRASSSADLSAFIANPQSWIAPETSRVETTMNGQSVTIQRSNNPRRLWREAHANLHSDSATKPVAFLANRWGLFQSPGYLVYCHKR